MRRVKFVGTRFDLAPNCPLAQYLYEKEEPNAFTVEAVEDTQVRLVAFQPTFPTNKFAVMSEEEYRRAGGNYALASADDVREEAVRSEGPPVKAEAPGYAQLRSQLRGIHVDPRGELLWARTPYVFVYDSNMEPMEDETVVLALAEALPGVLTDHPSYAEEYILSLADRGLTGAKGVPEDDIDPEEWLSFMEDDFGGDTYVEGAVFNCVDRTVIFNGVTLPAAQFLGVATAVGLAQRSPPELGTVEIALEFLELELYASSNPESVALWDTLRHNAKVLTHAR